MTSTRLPAKVLLDLAGRTVLSHVLERCRAIPGADVVCCAVPEGDLHEPVAAEARRCGAAVVRGSETDVLDRYTVAARTLGADLIMRVTSDCPLVDPAVCGPVLAPAATGKVDYACNNMPRSWPHGLDCEAFPFASLERAAQEAKAPNQREHVTPFLRTHPGLRRGNVANPRGDQGDHRWTLDYPADYAFLTAIFERLAPGPPGWSLEAVLDILARAPELSALNADAASLHR
jgi:spore coat polysaccharide biosynthesis protein SpsF